MTGVFEKGSKETSLNDLINTVKNNPNRDKAGAIVSFTGIVRRENKDKGNVKRLIIDSYKNMADKILNKIIEDEKTENIIDIQINHFIGEFLPGEDLVHVVVMGKHRADCFKTLERVVERYKKEAPFWKKEVFENGNEAWI